MLGLMSPVEDPKLNDMLPKEVILRKVCEVPNIIINSCYHRSFFCPLQKYLMCQPKHLSAAFYEFFFTNDSMNQMRCVSQPVLDPFLALLSSMYMYMCIFFFYCRAVYQVKPFPSFIPITIATYRDKEQHLLPELSEVRSLIAAP